MSTESSSEPRLHTAVRPFTDFDPNELGPRLSYLARGRRRLLRRDFPNTDKYYGSDNKAVETVKQRQESMQRDLGYQALAVVFGHSEDDGEVYGVTTNTMPDPDDRFPVDGPNMAIWVGERPPEFRGLQAMVPLMRARMNHLIASTAMTGRPWTVIRPENTASVAVWEHGEYEWGGFDKIGQPDRYPFDGQRKKRQLYVAHFALDTLRSQR